MIDDLLDGLTANLGGPRSVLSKRAERLPFGLQAVVFVLGVCFWSVTIILLYCLSNSLISNLSSWIVFPISLLVMYLVFELGFWFGLVLVEPWASDCNSKKDDK